ncbi:peptidase S8/S53 domain-containing protein [Pestalotiopsis sp. NC0098]|nr:peptidase S8/S53 domain-containing protein [Pestalotiopsis sp. NC0098]
MSVNLHLYQDTNDIIYNELSARKSQLAADFNILDADAITTENALDFYQFELDFPRVSGTEDHFERTTVAKNDSTGPDRVLENPNDLISAEIEESINKTNAQRGSMLLDNKTAYAPEHNDIITALDGLAKGILNGAVHKTVLSVLLPRDGLLGNLNSIVSINTFLEALNFGSWLRPASIRPKSAVPNIQHAAQADTLHNLLRAEFSCQNPKEHAALFQLSEWDNAGNEETMFRLFLSNCSAMGDWHKTTCSFGSMDTGKARKPSFDLCQRIRQTQILQTPLLLSFNNERLWNSRQQRLELRKEEQKPSLSSLKTLFQSGKLGVADLPQRVTAYRLAFRLVSSLCLLVQGPWIQEDWSSTSVKLIAASHDGDVKKPDEAYIFCRFIDESMPNDIGRYFSPGSSNAELCPESFLSLAQLLVDIANGGENTEGSGQDEKDRHGSLLEHVRQRSEDEHMQNYWNAVRGCLFYQEYYDETDACEQPNERLRAQDVIYNQIVLHLKKHLDLWETDLEDFEHGSNSSKVQRRSQSSTDGASFSGNAPTGVSWNTTLFTLWSAGDGDYPIVTASQAATNTNSFTAHMETFISDYIRRPEGYDGTRVRVAIIDSGFSIEESTMDAEGDPFLNHEDVRCRVKERRNFFSLTDETNKDDFIDKTGHGTQVARLVLKFAPEAELVIAKVTNSNKLSNIGQLVEALEWAGDRADIINLSFSLGSRPVEEVNRVMTSLINRGKLFFVAASNEDQWTVRPWPAKRDYVFPIHATTSLGEFEAGMNPNSAFYDHTFSTLGIDVSSYWEGSHRSISGTSFATPIAAAITANILEYARRKHPEIAEGLMRFGSILCIFKLMSGMHGTHNLILPWANGLWDGVTSEEMIREVLVRAAVG